MAPRLRAVQDAWAKEIGERIRAARTEAGLTQPELADLLVVHLRTIGNYEKGEFIPFKDLPRIAELLNTDIRWLLHGAAWQDPLDRINEQLEQILDRLPEPTPESERVKLEAEGESRAVRSEQNDAEPAAGKPGRRGKAP